MSLNNLLADAVARINNAQSARHSQVIVRHSKFVESVVALMNEQGYLGEYEVFEIRKGIRMIKIELKYHRGRKVISEMRVMSKPSCHLYRKAKRVPKTCGGLGVTIVSTSKGVMSDVQARSQGIGGKCLIAVS